MKVWQAAGQTKAAVFFNPRDWGVPADEGSDKAKIAFRAAAAVTCRRGSGLQRQGDDMALRRIGGGRRRGRPSAKPRSSVPTSQSRSHSGLLRSPLQHDQAYCSDLGDYSTLLRFAPCFCTQGPCYVMYCRSMPFFPPLLCV